MIFHKIKLLQGTKPRSANKLKFSFCANKDVVDKLLHSLTVSSIEPNELDIIDELGNEKLEKFCEEKIIIGATVGSERYVKNPQVRKNVK